jgi:hypothetical protein
MILPNSWTNTTPPNSETEAVQFTAPAAYGFAPTTYTVVSQIGYVPTGETAHQLADKYIANQKSAHPTFVAGDVMDCAVSADTASFFSWSNAGTNAYDLILIHNQLQYDVRLAGSGGLSDQAFSDFKEIMASWTWSA